MKKVSQNCKRLLQICLMLFLSCSLFSQITVDIKERPIKEALKDIESKSTFKFFYSNDLEGLDRVVSLKTANDDIDTILKQLFAQSKINYQKQENNIILLVAKQANNNKQENKIVRGVVKDENGNPLIGVSPTFPTKRTLRYF